MVHVILWLILDHAEVDWQVTISLPGANLISLSCFACRYDLRNGAENQQKELNLNKSSILSTYKIPEMFSNPQMLSVVPRGCHFVAWYYIWQPANQQWTGHFWVASRLCFKVRLSARPLIWKWFFILMQIKLIFITRVLQLAWFWK